MTFNIVLAVSLGICVVGLLLRTLRWFTGGLTQADRDLGASVRLRDAGSAVFKRAFGTRLPATLKGLVYDGLFQMRLYRADRMRWLAHILIFWGFILLLLFHAMDGVITRTLFSGYESTLNPWLWLRNVCGVVFLAGLALAVFRRMKKQSRLQTTAMDVAALVLVGAVVVSGFLLEGAKIASQSEFHSMVEEFYDPSATEDVAALEALWVMEYGLAARDPGAEYTKEQLTLGREVNEFSCAHCHDKPQSAAVSYGLAQALAPLSRDKDGGGLVSFTYWLHVLVFFGLLAWLPFGKMRHVITSPLSLIADRVGRREPVAPTRAVRRMLDMDACMRCGLCSDTCSVGISASMLSNPNILPSVKLAHLRGSPPTTDGTKALLEGLTVCTDCLRCTGVCPVGINLQDLWDASREELLASGELDVYALSPLGIHRSETCGDSFAVTQEILEAQRRQAFAEAGKKTVHDAGIFGGFLGTEGETGVFNLCFNCKTCTSSCPIVAHDDLDDLGLAPHQIIHATALGLDDLVASSRMLWACLGCYRCQESCPQGVRVTDVLYIHKNKALARMKGVTPTKED